MRCCCSFFFSSRRRHTRSLCDWSSDVCSSDLPYMTVEACKAGKDVYVEKPVCVAVNEGVVMVAAARKYNRIVQAGTWQRSGAHFQKACDLVRSGALGKIAFCRTWIYSNQKREGIGKPPESAPPP